MNKKIETKIIDTEIIYNDYYKNLEEEYIFSLMKNLNNTQKKIIIGRYIYGYSDDKLSKIFRISRQAVYKQRKKALGLIKIKIGENNNH